MNVWMLKCSKLIDLYILIEVVQAVHVENFFEISGLDITSLIIQGSDETGTRKDSLWDKKCPVITSLRYLISVPDTFG